MSPEPDKLEFIVPPNAAGQMLRLFLADALPLDPEDFIRQAILSGAALVNGEPANGRRVLRKGDAVAVEGLEAKRKAFHIELIRSDVLYEDDHVLVLNKPAGCTVVRERAAEVCPFQNGVLDHIRRSPGSAEACLRDRYRPRAVHRLDRDTTGAVVFAKSRAGELHLARQFQERTLTKEYLAAVHGELASDTGTVEAPVAPQPGDIERMTIGERGGKAALTQYEVVERFRGFTLVRAFPHTGRRHQIRVHLAHIGHPVVADRIYGGGAGFMLSSIKRRYRLREGQEEKPLVARPALHSAAITFLPVSATDAVRVEAPLPRDFQALLKMLRKYA